MCDSQFKNTGISCDLYSFLHLMYLSCAVSSSASAELNLQKNSSLCALLSKYLEQVKTSSYCRFCPQTYWDHSLQTNTEVLLLIKFQFLEGHSCLSYEFIVSKLVLVTHRKPANNKRCTP